MLVSLLFWIRLILSTSGLVLDIVILNSTDEQESLQKIDQMYSIFCNQPLERVRKFTERDYFFSAAEVHKA